MALPKEKAFSLTTDSIKDLSSTLSYIANRALPYRESLVRRSELVKQYLEVSSDRTETTAKGRIVNQAGDKSKIGGMEIAAVKIHKETACAFLGGTFLSGYPIFAATADREREGVAEMLNALTGRDQDMFSWGAELLQCHEDVLINPICGVEVEWTRQKANTVGQGLNAAGETITVSEVTSYEGNKIKRLEPINILFDTSVPPHKVHSEGTFAGYVERLPYIAMKAMYDSLEPLYTIKINRPAIFQGESQDSKVAAATVNNLYKCAMVHHTRSSGEAQTTGTDWAQWWGGNNEAKPNKTNLVGGQFEIVRLYARMNLREFGYTSADNGIHIVKLIWINGVIAYIEPLFQGHGLLPIVLGQYQSGDVNTTTFCEYLLGIQDLGTSLLGASLASMRRAVNDRALYDPSRISKALMEDPNPQAKIPVNMNAYQSTFDTAYRQIPYTDTISGNLTSMMQLVERLGMQTVGQNPAAQGTFVKGNKTREEFNTIMSNSDSRMQLGALFLEQHFYSAIKHILRFNYLLYASSGDVAASGMDTVVPVDIATLRTEAPMYKMATGLMPITKLAGTDVLMQTVQFMMTSPQLQLEYDVGGMMISVAKQLGVQGLDQYKRTPEQAQQAAALQQPPQPPAQGGQPPEQE